MNHHSPALSRLLGVGLGLALVGLTACSSDQATTVPATEAGATSTTGPVETTPDTTPAETTLAPDTTLAATTTTAPALTLFLRADGLGGVPFGETDVATLAALAERLGAPDTDERRAYPTPDTGIGHVSADGEYGFALPFGREVCWLEGFCAAFGGENAATLTFVGWNYGGDSTGAMSTDAGITVGSRWADFPSMEINPGGCYSVGNGTVDGITLWVQSTGTPFAEFDESGNYVEHLPTPEEVTVMSLEAGDIPLFMYGDC